MTRAESLLKELRDVYDGSPWYGDSVRTMIADVDDAAVARTPRIAELLGHITSWMEISARRVSGEVFEVTDAMNFPAVTGVAWRDQLQRLANAHERLISIVERHTDADLDRIVPGKKHTIEFELRGIVQHCIYHAGQIALLKKH